MKQFVYIFFFIANCLLSTVNCFSQDPQYSQFYAAPLYLNPALTGTISYGRIAANARNQWKKNVNRFDSRAFSADFTISKYNIGVGALITRDYAGYDAIYDLPGIGPANKGLRQTNVGLLGSYFIPIDRHWYTRAGMHFSYTFRNYTFDDLLFGDMLSTDGNNKPQSSVESAGDETIRYFDLNAGGFLYSNFVSSTNYWPINYWLGLSLHHLTRPDQSFIEGKSPLPIKTSVQAGAKIPVGNLIMKNKYETSISPAIMYKRQGKFDQLDLGTYFYFSPLIIGAWYRGLPGLDAKPGLNSESFIVLVGFRKAKLYGFDNVLQIGFSYDVPLSQLGSSTTGSKEISIIYEYEVFGFNRKKKPKFKEMTIPCPKL